MQSQGGNKYQTYNKKGRVNSVGLILSVNCLLEHFIEEGGDEEEGVSSYRMT